MLLQFWAKCYFLINHIINTIVSMTFLFGVFAISPYLQEEDMQTSPNWAELPKT